MQYYELIEEWGDDCRWSTLKQCSELDAEFVKYTSHKSALQELQEELSYEKERKFHWMGLFKEYVYQAASLLDEADRLVREKDGPDYEQLLWKYIEHVGQCEGCDFIERVNWVGSSDVIFTAEEVAQLKAFRSLCFPEKFLR